MHLQLPDGATLVLQPVQIGLAPALIDQVHDLLVGAIVDGRLAPGERLTQGTVAEKLGVSRQPVSHALQVLKRRGLLVESGKRGLSVAPIDADRLTALYQVREALDGLAAGLAAARCRSRAIPDEQLREVCAIVKHGQALAPDAPVSARISADVAFHSAIYRMSGNGAISETVTEQWPHFMRSMGQVLTVPGMRDRVWREHVTILSRILAGDADGATGEARLHARRSGDETARRLRTASANDSPSAGQPATTTTKAKEETT